MQVLESRNRLQVGTTTSTTANEFISWSAMKDPWNQLTSSPGFLSGSTRFSAGVDTRRRLDAGVRGLMTNDL